MSKICDSYYMLSASTYVLFKDQFFNFEFVNEQIMFV